MSGQDILIDLSKYESSLIQRRLLTALIFILVGYWATFNFLNASIHFVLGRLELPWHHLNTSSSLPPAAHLVKAVTGRSSSYRLENSLVAVTAVVSSKNLKAFNRGALELLLRFLVQYPFIREIIIWNDHVIKTQINLNADDLLSKLNSTIDRRFLPILRVINSPGGMREMSNHMACSLAKFNTCYHVDENKLNLNLDTLYTKYMESDGESNASIIQHASPEEYLIESPFNVVQPGHSLHSGVVSQLSRGSLAAKHLSTRYFQQLSTSLLSNDHSKFRSSIPDYVSNDIQFSVWSNRRPLKLVTSPQSTVSINPSAQEVAFLDVNFIHDTFRKLNETIEASDPFLVPNLFPRALFNQDPKTEPEIGVASAYDDRSMLITDLNFSRDWPLAIDGDLSTCWNPLSTITEQSFVGLNFVQTIELDQFTVFGKFEAKIWKLETYSSKEKKWRARQVIPTITQHSEPPLTKYVYDVADVKTSTPSFQVKKIRLKLDPSSLPFQPQLVQEGFSLCGWMINENWVI